MLELPDDSAIEKLNNDALARINAVANMDAFDEDLEGMLAAMDDMVETGVEGLDKGMTKAAVFAILVQYFQDANPQNVQMILAAAITDAATELFIAELTYELEEDTEE